MRYMNKNYIEFFLLTIKSLSERSSCNQSSEKVERWNRKIRAEAAQGEKADTYRGEAR